MILRILGLLALLVVSAVPLPGRAEEELFALAQLDLEASGLVEHADGFDLVLKISQPVPYRVATLTNPPRLVLDFREVDFSRMGPGGLGYVPAISGMRHGAITAGWSRLVVDLKGPFAVETAVMQTGMEDGSARIEVAMRETDEATFNARSGAQAGGSDGSESEEAATSHPVPQSDEVLKVVLDPGHGGIDPGAIYDGVHEADLVLTFAQELRETLLRNEGFDVVLTRTDDSFVSLEARIAIARRAGAEVFISLHADAVSEGIARGAQVYTLSDRATSAATRKLAERHDRGDLLAGVDLSDQDDEVARVLMSIARNETTPRTEALAGALVQGLRAAGVRLHKRPKESAGFSVLKTPDVPSVLVELGFMSNPKELEKLQNPDWRKSTAEALSTGLAAWAAEDRARDELKRK
ncbi:N-acetylmuramoyl-L-alanine amidase [Aliiruegeria haliotis]|nr:N-acetylmuramoyl-L-alanine amidase [Aliiruegeria haliotis]